MRNFKLLMFAALIFSFAAVQENYSQKLSTITSVSVPDTLKQTAAKDTVILTFTQTTYKYGLHPFAITLIPTKISGTVSGGAYLQYSEDNVNWDNFSLTDTAVISNSKITSNYKIHTWTFTMPFDSAHYPHPYWRILARCTSATQATTLQAIFTIRE